MKQKPQNQIRSGFTLLELLIVVAIIAVLASLSVVVMLNIEEQAHEAATVVTIRKIDGILQQRMEAYYRTFDRGGGFAERYEDSVKSLLRQKNIYGVRPEVIKVMARKVGFRHNFPQRHEDLLILGFGRGGTGKTARTDFNGDDTIMTSGRSIDTNYNQIADIVEATSTDISKLQPYTIFNANKTVSAELLYYTLVHGANFGASPAVADQFSASEIADTDDDGFPEFVDSWGEPIRFYRWPTRLIDPSFPLTTAGQQPVLSLPSDPTDVRIDFTEDDGSGGTVANHVGVRVSDGEERQIANLVFKGLPPRPFPVFSSLSNVSLPRDLLLVDPDDPVGRIYADLERLDGTNGKPQLLLEYSELWYHTMETYHVPLLVSAGSDGELGLYEPTEYLTDTDGDDVGDTVVNGHLAMYDIDLSGNGTALEAVDFQLMKDQLSDNLTNRNRRAGARR